MYPSVSGGTASIAELEEYMMVDFYQDALELVSVSRELCRRLTCICGAAKDQTEIKRKDCGGIGVIYNMGDIHDDGDQIQSNENHLV